MCFSLYCRYGAATEYGRSWNWQSPANLSPKVQLSQPHFSSRDIYSRSLPAAAKVQNISEGGTGSARLAGVDAAGRKAACLHFRAQLQRSSIAAALEWPYCLVICPHLPELGVLFGAETLILPSNKPSAVIFAGITPRACPEQRGRNLSDIIAQVEQLASMLQAKQKPRSGEGIPQKSISDISTPLKTPPWLPLHVIRKFIADETRKHPIRCGNFPQNVRFAEGVMEYMIQAMRIITRLNGKTLRLKNRISPWPTLIFPIIRELTKTRAERENKRILVDGDAGQQLVCDRDWTCEAIGNIVIVKNALDHTGPGGTVRIHLPLPCCVFSLQITAAASLRRTSTTFSSGFTAASALCTPRGSGWGSPDESDQIEGARAA